MLVQFLDAPGFAIAENGELTRSARWLLSADPDDGDFGVAAMLWAGTVGSAWRTPNAAGDGYSPDDTLRITKVHCKVLDASSCEIHYSGASRLGSAAAIPGTYRLERRANLEEFKQNTFKVPALMLANFLPAIGDTIDWAGGEYRCEKVEVSENSDDTFNVQITAVNTAIRAEGDITTEDNAEFEQLKTGVWLVRADALADFLSTHAVHATAADWAGENFYIHEVATAPANSARRTRVTLKARLARLKLIEALRHESIASLGGTSPECEIVWTSRWHGAAADKAIFENQLGADASDWAENGFIVSRITPQRISDCEYEYALEARQPETIIPDEKRKYWTDRDLPDRHEYYIRVGEVRFSPLQCGYCWGYRGNYTQLGNWIAARQCPLVATAPLDRRWINQALKLLEVVEISYLSGRSSGHISTIAGWLVGGRVDNSTLAGVSGSWLKVDLDVDDVTDSRDRHWTKISKVYRRAPRGYSWNGNYWV